MTALESTVRRRELGRGLRSAQERAGFAGKRLATLLGWTDTKVSRMINGRALARDVDVAAVLALCGVIGAPRERMLQLCRPYEDEGLLRLPVGERWPAYLEHARDTSRLVDVQPLMIPWLVQTPDYTRALLPVAAECWERRSAVGLVQRPRVDLVLYEGALRTPVGDAGLMSEQLAHLLRISAGASVSVRIVPVGHAVLTAGYGPFTLLEFADRRTVVYREEPGAGVFVDNELDVRAYRTVLGHVNRVALVPERSRELIVQVAAECYGDRDTPTRAPARIGSTVEHP